MSASNEDEVGGWRHQQMGLIKEYGYKIPMRTVKALAAIFRVHLEDGTVRVEAGEKVEYMSSPSAGCPRWENKDPVNPDRLPPPPTSALAHLVPGKLWYYFGNDNVRKTVERRRIAEVKLEQGIAVVRERWPMPKGETVERAPPVELERWIVVFREGLSMPKGELVRVVNAAYAVLALRRDNEYFYLRNNFALSASEEDAMVEWGLGRPLFANSLLAAGGTLLVCFAEQVWRPAVVGTLLVVAAGYRVQGALTKVLRVRSTAWSANLLVPSGIHRTERAVQSVLVTILALADVLDDRVLLLTALTLASVQVVVLEAVGQAVLTWGISKYMNILRKQLMAWTFVCAGMAAFVWVVYVFAGFFGVVTCMFGVLTLGAIVVVVVVAACGPADKDRRDDIFTEFGACYAYFIVICCFPSVGLGVWAAVEGWAEADLKYSWRSLQPWRWPLSRSTDAVFSSFREVGLWFGATVAYLFLGYVVVGLLSFRISSDTDPEKPRGERVRVRETSRFFARYSDEKPIPSRNLLEVNSRVAAPVATVV
eukprot:g4393.t1